MFLFSTPAPAPELEGKRKWFQKLDKYKRAEEQDPTVKRRIFTDGHAANTSLPTSTSSRSLDKKSTPEPSRSKTTTPEPSRVSSTPSSPAPVPIHLTPQNSPKPASNVASPTAQQPIPTPQQQQTPTPQQTQQKPIPTPTPQPTPQVAATEPTKPAPKSPTLPQNESNNNLRPAPLPRDQNTSTTANVMPSKPAPIPLARDVAPEIPPFDEKIGDDNNEEEEEEEEENAEGQEEEEGQNDEGQEEGEEEYDEEYDEEEEEEDPIVITRAAPAPLPRDTKVDSPKVKRPAPARFKIDSPKVQRVAPTPLPRNSENNTSSTDLNANQNVITRPAPLPRDSSTPSTLNNPTEPISLKIPLVIPTRSAPTPQTQSQQTPVQPTSSSNSISSPQLMSAPPPLTVPVSLSRTGTGNSVSLSRTGTGNSEDGRHSRKKEKEKRRKKRETLILFFIQNIRIKSIWFDDSPTTTHTSSNNINDASLTNHICKFG